MAKKNRLGPRHRTECAAALQKGFVFFVFLMKRKISRKKKKKEKTVTKVAVSFTVSLGDTVCPSSPLEGTMSL